MLKSAIYRGLYTTFLFLSGIVLANLLQPVYFGKLSLLTLNTGIVSLITGLGIDSVLMHYLTNNKWSIAQASTFVIKALGLQILLFLLLQTIVVQIWHSTLLSFSSNEYLLFETIYFTGFILTEKYITLLYARHYNLLANIFSLITSILYFLLLLVLSRFYLLEAKSLFTVFAIQSLFLGLGLLILFYYKERKLVFVIKDTVPLQLFFKSSLMVMITNLIQLLAYRCDFWFLEKFRSTFEVGIYAQANKFANLVWIVPNIIAMLLLPKFGSLKKTDILSVFRVGMLLSILLALVAFIFTKLFYRYILQDIYSEGLLAFYYMLPGYFFWTLVIYYAAYFSWAGLFKLNFVGSVFCLFLIVLLDSLLIPKYGFNGAAIANTVAYTFTFVLYLFLLNKKYGYKLKDLVVLRSKDIRVLKLLN